MKKALRESQTLRACRSPPHRRTESAMAVVRQSQNPPPRRPLPGAQDRQNLTSWRWSLPAPTDPVWWRSIYAISSYRGNRHCPPAKNTQTHRQDRLQCTAPLPSAQCIYCCAQSTCTMFMVNMFFFLTETVQWKSAAVSQRCTRRTKFSLLIHNMPRYAQRRAEKFAFRNDCDLHSLWWCGVVSFVTAAV